MELLIPIYIYNTTQTISIYTTICEYMYSENYVRQRERDMDLEREKKTGEKKE